MHEARFFTDIFSHIGQERDDIMFYFAFNLVDPWENLFELNCYDYDVIKTELVDADGIEPERYWPRSVYENRRTT